MLWSLLSKVSKTNCGCAYFFHGCCRSTGLFKRSSVQIQICCCSWMFSKSSMACWRSESDVSCRHRCEHLRSTLSSQKGEKWSKKIVSSCWNYELCIHCAIFLFFYAVVIYISRKFSMSKANAFFVKRCSNYISFCTAEGFQNPHRCMGKSPHFCSLFRWEQVCGFRNSFMTWLSFIWIFEHFMNNWAEYICNDGQGMLELFSSFSTSPCSTCTFSSKFCTVQCVYWTSKEQFAVAKNFAV